MQITLNRANKIRSLLEAKITSVHNMRVSTGINVLSSRSVGFIKEEMAGAKGKVTEDVADKIMFIEKLFELRQIISEANHQHGVNKIINNIAELNLHIKYFTHLVSGNGYSLDDFVELQRNVKPDAPVQRVTIEFFSQEEREKWNGQLEDVKAALRALEEERNALNHKTMVTLPDDLVAVLKNNKLL